MTGQQATCSGVPRNRCGCVCGNVFTESPGRCCAGVVAGELGLNQM